MPSASQSKHTGQRRSPHTVCPVARKNSRRKAVYYTVGFASRKRLFSTEAQIWLSYKVENELFRLNFFRLSSPTGGSSRKRQLFRLDPPVEKLNRKGFTRFFLNHRISLIPPPRTRPHAHTLIPGTTQQYHTRR